MKYLILGIFVLSLFGCKPTEPQMVVVPIRGCEYVMVRDNHGISLSHAGDCQNPIHFGKKAEKTNEGKLGLKPAWSFDKK